jgi:lipopolysaccharide transport system ATP-binding protein
MYVRLAFAVAAHLEPEILIVDEVLAVGDAEFQKKCLGKMKDVAGHGRTILFVSHNLTAVRELCSTGVYLKNGGVEMDSKIGEVVSKYVFENIPVFGHQRSLENLERDSGLGGQIQMTHVRFLGDCSRVPFGKVLEVELRAKVFQNSENVFFGVGVSHPGGSRLFTVEGYEQKIPFVKSGQELKIRVKIPESGLPPGTYALSVGVAIGLNYNVDFIIDALPFEVFADDQNLFYGERPNMGLRIRSGWEYELL